MNSKNHPIVLKFGTDVAFIYQIEFVALNIVPLRTKIFQVNNFSEKLANHVISIIGHVLGKELVLYLFKYKILQLAQFIMIPLFAHILYYIKVILYTFFPHFLLHLAHL